MITKKKIHKTDVLARWKRNIMQNIKYYDTIIMPG